MRSIRRAINSSAVSVTARSHKGVKNAFEARGRRRNLSWPALSINCRLVNVVRHVRSVSRLPAGNCRREICRKRENWGTANRFSRARSAGEVFVDANYHALRILLPAFNVFISLSHFRYVVPSSDVRDVRMKEASWKL